MSGAGVSSSVRTAAAPTTLRIRLLLAGMMVLFAATFACLGIVRHRNYWTWGDLAVETNILWNMVYGRPYHTTLMGPSHHIFCNHLFVMFGPLGLVYGIFCSPEFYIAFQAAVLALSAWPVFCIARRVIGREDLAFLWSAVFLLHPATGYLALNNVHITALAIPVHLLGFHFYLKGRYGPFLACVMAALLCKEEFGLVYAGVGLYVALDGRPRLGLPVAALGCAWFLLAVGVIMPWYAGGSLWQFFRYAHLGEGIGEVLGTLVLDPARVVEHYFHSAYSARIGRFVVLLLLPFGFLSLLAPRQSVLFIVPLFYNTLSLDWRQQSIKEPYLSSILPFLVIASIFGTAKVMRLGRRLPAGRRRLVGVATAAMLVPGCVLANAKWSSLLVWNRTFREPSTGNGPAIDAALCGLPEDVCVAASTHILPHMSNRRHVTFLEIALDGGEYPEVIVADFDGPCWDSARYKANMRKIAALADEGGYRVAASARKFAVLSRDDRVVERLSRQDGSNRFREHLCDIRPDAGDAWRRFQVLGLRRSRPSRRTGELEYFVDCTLRRTPTGWRLAGTVYSSALGSLVDYMDGYVGADRFVEPCLMVRNADTDAVVARLALDPRGFTSRESQFDSLPPRLLVSFECEGYTNARGDRLCDDFRDLLWNGARPGGRPNGTPVSGDRDCP